MQKQSLVTKRSLCTFMTNPHFESIVVTSRVAFFLCSAVNQLGSDMPGRWPVWISQWRPPGPECKLERAWKIGGGMTKLFGYVSMIEFGDLAPLPISSA